MLSALRENRARQFPEKLEHRVWVSRLGRYLVWLTELGDDRGLRLREELTKKVAERVAAEFGASAGYFSVLNSDDYDAAPFYSDVGFDDDGIYMNSAHEADDYQERSKAPEPLTRLPSGRRARF